MTISNGQIISASDVNAVYTSTLSTLQSLRVVVPTLTWLHTSFAGVISGSSTTFKSHNIILPDDFILAEVCITSGDGNGVDTVTVDNGAMLQPISMTNTRAAGFVKAARWYSDVSKNKQILLKGSILTVALSTTNTSASSTLQVSIGLLSEKRQY